jgi:P2X purinoceptor 4
MLWSSSTSLSPQVGLIFRLLQLAIIGYVIGYAIVYQKGYQERDTAVSSVITKVCECAGGCVRE